MNARNLLRQIVTVFAAVIVSAVLFIPFLLVVMMLLPVAPCVLPVVVAAFVQGGRKPAVRPESPVGLARAIPELA